MGEVYLARDTKLHRDIAIKVSFYVVRGLVSRGGTYDVTPDGRRFLMLKTVGDPGQLAEQADRRRREELGRRAEAPAAAAAMIRCGFRLQPEATLSREGRGDR